MGMQINTNVAALNAYRNLSGTQGAMNTSLERLSSGLRINRAADDAAGLAISEKLRSQVNGLNQAQSNAQDGVSLIQTAEGALNETHSILQRMRTLAVQSASDSNTNTDRAAIQKEINALVTEINSTTERTQFNGMNLLDGTFLGKSLQIGANQMQTMDVKIDRMDAKGLGVSDYANNMGVKAATTTTTATLGTLTGTNPLTASTSYEVRDNAGQKELWNTATNAKAADINAAGTLIGTATNGITVTALKVGDKFTTGASVAASATFSVTTAQTATEAGTGGGLKANMEYDVRTGTNGNEIWTTGDKAEFVGKLDSTNMILGSGSNTTTFLGALGPGTRVTTGSDGKVSGIFSKDTDITTSGAVVAGNYTVGVDSKDPSKMVVSQNGKEVGTVATDGKSVSFYDGSSATFANALNTTTNNKFSVAQANHLETKDDKIDLSTRAGAVDSLKRIDEAIKRISDQRADLGALQNRLQHTVANLGVSAENLAASESRIRDADMAKEMTAFTRSQILQQAGVSMLAQANQSSQSVLKLLG